MTAVVLRADARRLPLPDGCVDLVVTSPPFWQLRSYTDNGVHYDGQVGSEPTPREYVDSLLACTREWVRVLKPSGSLFVELGDKYATRYSSLRGGGRAGLNGDDDTRGRGGQNHTGAGEKSLIGLPWRYAIRCIDELGLILRAEIVWHHVNGLPESVTDRVRRAHSTVFHFTVQPRYYAAVDEIREPHSEATHARGRNGTMARDGDPLPTWGTAGTQSLRGVDKRYTAPDPLGKLPGSVWDIPSQPLTVPAALGVDHFAAWPMELPRRIIRGWSPPGVCTACGEGRRPVVDRKPMPAALKTLAHRKQNGPARDGNHGPGRSDTEYNINGREMNRWRALNPDAITGYACACSQDVLLPGRDVTADGSTVTTYREPAEDRARQEHLPPTRPALVVDPFGGTGTTALVAAAYGRTGVSVDLSGDYCRLARWRTADPAERARALLVPKPPPVPDGQGSLFDDEAV